MKFPTTTTATTVSMSSLLLLVVVVVVPTLSFTPSSFLSAPYSTTTKHQHPHPQFVKNQINSPSSTTKTKTKTSLYSSIGGLSGKVALTPQGYGFLSTTERVLTQAKRGNNGYYKANSNDKVIDVMGGMTNGGGGEDVALVYEKGNLQGIFTETDYIEVCCSLWYSYHYFIMYIYIYIYIYIYVMFLIVLVLIMIIYLYIHILLLLLLLS